MCAVDNIKETDRSKMYPRTLCFRVRGSLMKRGASCVTVQGRAPVVIRLHVHQFKSGSNDPSS